MITKRLFISLLAVTAVLLVGCDKDKNDDPATFSITVTSGNNGTAVADKTEAAEGVTVTLTATPDEGYEFSGWTVINGGVTLSPDNTTTEVTFTMPAADVSVKAEFVASQKELSYNISIDETGTLNGNITGLDRNTPVTLSYRTHGGTGTATSVDLALGNSDASGKATASGELQDKTPRVIEFSADNYLTSKLITFGTVPTGFLTNKTADRMSQAEARAFAAYHGGRLPLVGGKTEYKWSEYTEAINSTTVDGFGIYNVSEWPAGVPTTGSIWTDTEDTEYNDGTYWLITHSLDGKFGPGSTWEILTETWWVICLP